MLIAADPTGVIDGSIGYGMFWRERTIADSSGGTNRWFELQEQPSWSAFDLSLPITLISRCFLQSFPGRLIPESPGSSFLCRHRNSSVVLQTPGRYPALPGNQPETFPDCRHPGTASTCTRPCRTCPRLQRTPEQSTPHDFPVMLHTGILLPGFRSPRLTRSRNPSGHRRRNSHAPLMEVFRRVLDRVRTGLPRFLGCKVAIHRS